MILLAVGPPALAAVLVAPKLALLACFLPAAIAVYVLWNVVLMHSLAWALSCLVWLAEMPHSRE